jgi:hypothetical protein
LTKWHTAKLEDNVMTDAEFFASGHRIIKKAIAVGPVAFGVRLGIAMALLLLAGSRLAGVHSFPVRSDDRGFWFEPHWSIMFVVVFPALFGGLVHMISLMRDAIARLTHEPLSVITKNGAPAPDFEGYIAEHISKRAFVFTVTCVILATALTAVHGASLGSYLLGWRGTPPILDWATMFSTGQAEPAANISFVVVAYACEALTIFIGFFFVLKFWLFLNVFSETLRDEGTGYEFRPLVYDPDRRLGLRPLGAFMNLYLLLVIIFEVYILGRRLQLIGKVGDFSLSAYLTKLASGASSFVQIFDPRMYQWHTIDAGLWALLIFLTLPLVVGAYFPLWTLRRYVRRRRDNLWEESARAHEMARERGDDAEAEKLARRMTQLQGTQLWPNGDSRGWRLLAVSIGVGVAAWAPPLCVSLLVTGAAAETVKWLLQRKPAGEARVTFGSA